MAFARARFVAIILYCTGLRYFLRRYQEQESVQGFGGIDLIVLFIQRAALSRRSKAVLPFDKTLVDRCSFEFWKFVHLGQFFIKNAGVDDGANI